MGKLCALGPVGFPNHELMRRRISSFLLFMASFCWQQRDWTTTQYTLQSPFHFTKEQS